MNVKYFFKFPQKINHLASFKYFCEFDNLEDAEKKIYELYYRLIISNENNINEFFYIKDKKKFLITKKLIKEKFKNKNIIYFTNYKKYNYLDILLKIINEK